MAKMIDKIPSFEGEKITWEFFSANLPQQYVVYNTRSVKGWEFDFCILAEAVGLFIVEVKGWKPEDIFNVISEDVIILSGEEEPQSSPRKQARGYRFNMVNLLKQELGMNPLVMDLVCYPLISKEEYYSKRLNVVSDETETIFKEDLADATKLYKKLIGRYNINKSTPHDEFNAKRFALVRHHFEPNYDLKENVEDLNPGYSRLRIECNSLTEERIEEIVNEYFVGIKEIVFVDSQDTLRKLVRFVESKLYSKKITPEKGNLSVGTRSIEISELEDSYSIFNFEVYYVKELSKYVEKSLLIEEGIFTNEEKSLLQSLAEATPFNFQQYEIEHAPANTNIMVAAGAGTGKTYSMVSRVAYLCNRTADAVVDIVNDIAMITFTKDAAENMNSRLKRMFMNYFVLTSNEKYMHLIEDMSQIHISTIHKFAISLLHKECMRMGLGYDSQITSETYDRRKLYHVYLNSYLSKKTEENPDFVHQLTVQSYELENMYKVAPETEEKHKSLKNARELWIATVEVTGKLLYEIYTGHELSIDEFDLDHFVPRSFVSNDELWNLTPMAKKLNSSKNNRLPEKAFIKDFIEYNYYLYGLIFDNCNKDQARILRHYFERCENQHLNAIWAAEKLYIPGNTKEQFSNLLEENLSLVYDSARLQEYEIWVF